jgi:hypothetical protein
MKIEFDTETVSLTDVQNILKIIDDIFNGTAYKMLFLKEDLSIGTCFITPYKVGSSIEFKTKEPLYDKPPIATSKDLKR